jgi:RHS repeat-associated protein
LQLVANDSNHYKFTGKERDSETGLDYFGARYYSNGLGRFITPDWAAKATAVPYAEFADPQSLNLYSYVRNVPTTKYDADGHCPGDDCSNVKVEVKVLEQPKIVQGETQEDGSVKTGVRAKVQDTITVNGKPLDHGKVDETNVNKVTLNGQAKNLNNEQGPNETNNAGQVNDTVGLLAPAGTPQEDAPLINILQTGAVTYTNENTITFTTPSGDTCSCTATRTVTNVGSDGKASSNYTIDPGTPTVKPAQQQKPTPTPQPQPKDKQPQ